MRLKSSSNMAAAVLLVLALVVLITLLSERHYLRWDLTSSGEHSLSEKTLQVLKTIREPVKIKAFAGEGRQGAEGIRKLLDAYRYRAPQITYELIDPDRNPAVARRYNVRSLNTLVMEGYRSSQTVKTPDEEEVTNALIRLSKNRRQKVYWLSGHGERSLKGPEPGSFSLLQENLSKENYTFEEIRLMERDIPEDTTLLMVAAPEKPLFPEEIDSIRRYLDTGGSVIVFLEPFLDGGLKDFLKDYGILVSQDVIVDKLSRVMGGDYLLPMVANYGVHEITKDFRLTSFFSLARSVEEVRDKPKGVKLTGLAFTSTNSWAETDHEALEAGRIALDEGEDAKGPNCLAVIAELRGPLRKRPQEKENPGDPSKGTTGQGKLVVFGDSDFASNKFLNLSGNGDLINNTINYLIGRQDLITIPDKHRPVEALALSRTQGMILFWVPVVLIPLILLAVGVIVWNRRRSR